MQITNAIGSAYDSWAFTNDAMPSQASVNGTPPFNGLALGQPEGGWT